MLISTCDKATHVYEWKKEFNLQVLWTNFYMNLGKYLIRASYIL